MKKITYICYKVPKTLDFRNINFDMMTTVKMNDFENYYYIFYNGYNYIIPQLITKIKYNITEEDINKIKKFLLYVKKNHINIKKYIIAKTYKSLQKEVCKKTLNPIIELMPLAKKLLENECLYRYTQKKRLKEKEKRDAKKQLFSL